MKNKAQLNFWKMPELVAQLLDFLDPDSILALGQCHQLVLDLLSSGTFTWNKLIKRTCPQSVRTRLGEIQPTGSVTFPSQPLRSDELLMTNILVGERAEMAKLVDILRQLEDPKSHLLALLHLICQRFPPSPPCPRLGVVDLDDGENDDEEEDNFVNINTAYGPQLVMVTIGSSPSCSVSLLGFWLLVEVEEQFGDSFEVKIDGIVIDVFQEPWLTWIKLRGNEVMARFDTHTVRCNNLDEVEIALQQHQNKKMEFVELTGEIGAEGLSCLAKALAARPRMNPSMVETSKRCLHEAAAEDLRAIWGHLMPRGNLMAWSLCRKFSIDFFVRDGGDEEEELRQLLEFASEDLSYCCEDCNAGDED